MTQGEPVVFFNGEIKPESQVGISIRDRGYLYGAAVFDADGQWVQVAAPLLASRDPDRIATGLFVVAGGGGPARRQKKRKTWTQS